MKHARDDVQSLVKRASPRRPPPIPLTQFASAVLGRVESFAGGRLAGWAWTPRRPGYPVLVHAFDASRVIASRLVVAPREPGRLLNGSAYRFELNLASLPEKRWPHLSCVVAEVDDQLPMDPGVESILKKKRPSSPTITVEDLLGPRVRKSWIWGGTYWDAVEAGVGVHEIIDVIYYDLLGRPADPHGLEYYARSIHSGAQSFDDIRRSLLDSKEFLTRTLPVGRMVGAAFSNRLIYGPTLPFPGEEKSDRRRKVSARSLLPLWGEGFLEAAYAAVCGARLPPELRRPMLAALDDPNCTKFDVVQQFLAIANAVSSVVAIEGEDALKGAPLKRFHLVPASNLPGSGAEDLRFVEAAVAAICGEATPSATLEEALARLSRGDDTREDMLIAIVAEARRIAKIPAIIAYDQPLAGPGFDKARVDELDLALDDAIVGYGWYGSERTDGESFRWMPQAAGIVVPPLALEGDEVVLKLEGSNFLDQRAISSLTCTINGVLLTGEVKVQEARRWSFTSDPVERSRLDRCYPYIVELAVSDESVPQNPDDNRYLTVAISRISLREPTLQSPILDKAPSLRPAAPTPNSQSRGDLANYFVAGTYDST